MVSLTFGSNVEFRLLVQSEKWRLLNSPKSHQTRDESVELRARARQVYVFIRCRTMYSNPCASRSELDTGNPIVLLHLFLQDDPALRELKSRSRYKESIQRLAQSRNARPETSRGGGRSDAPFLSLEHVESSPPPVRKPLPVLHTEYTSCIVLFSFSLISTDTERFVEKKAPRIQKTGV